MKPRAPRLLPSFSNAVGLPTALPISASDRKPSTVPRIRTTANAAWSRPSSDNTPRICARRSGTAISGWVSVVLRKNWSISFSTSPREVRNSPTTLPMVWRSLTRRYRSSIHASSGSDWPPACTRCRRCARCSARWAVCTSSAPSSSNVACRYNTAVATSMANAADGGSPERATASVACASASASGALPGCRRRKESPTRLNWSSAGLSLWRSPPANADQVSVAAATRLRAWARTVGS